MGILRIIKSFLGYIWAVLAICITIICFVNMQTLENWITNESGLKVSDNWTGGKIESVIEHQNYQTILHQPVFPGLFSKSKRGFIQIDWTTSDILPSYIEESFDFNHDNQIDFSIYLDTINNTAELTPYSNRIISIKDQEVLVFDNSRTIRVNINRN